MTKEIQDTFWGDRMFYLKDPDGFTLSFAKTIRQMSDEEMASASSAASTQSR